MCARARLAFVALHSLNFFCLFVFIQFIICFCCRILFGSMTAPPCVLSSTLFVHMHRCVALRSCCFLLLICWCTQHETITIAPAKSATILNKSERTMSKSIIYYVNSMETQRFQPYTHSLFFNRVLEVTIDIIYGMSTISKRKTRDLLQFFSYCLTMSWLRFTIFIRAHI